MPFGVPATIQFSVTWKILWSKYATITLAQSIGKNFVTSYNNVCLRWRSVLKQGNSDPSKTAFSLCYEDGPLEKFNGMSYTVAIVKSDHSTSDEMTTDQTYEAVRSGDFGWQSFEDIDRAVVRQKYGLQESDVLIYRIVLSIPLSVFTYKIENPLPATTPPQWLVDLFNVLDDPEKSVQSNIKLISRDGHRFYCHQIISFQSAALDAMFRHPPGENQAENEYPFPGLGKDSLKALIEYLYTGQATLGSLSTADLIELADGAEQYNLKPLKQACASVLWDLVVMDPCSCCQLVQFTALHEDMKYLKIRAMDVLAENSEMVNPISFGEGNEGKKLHDEFLLYACRRVASI